MPHKGRYDGKAARVPKKLRGTKKGHMLAKKMMKKRGY